MEEQEIDVRAILGVLRRRLRLVIVVLLTTLAVTAGVVFSLKPHYTASALILVDPSRKDILDPTAMPTTSSSADSARVDSEVEIVESVPTLLKVIAATDLMNDPEFMPKIGLRQQLLAFFRIAEPQLPTGEAALSEVVTKLGKAVSVQRKGLTYLIAVSAQAASAKTAANIANALADAYIQLQVQSKVQSVSGVLSLLEPRVAEASAALAASESAFDTFVDDNLQRIVSETGRQDLAGLQRDLNATISERDRLSTVVETASQSLSAMNYDALASSLQSDALAALEQQRADLMGRLNTVAASDPAATDLRAELGALNSQLQQAAQDGVASVRGQIASTQQRATDLREQLRQSVLGSDLPPNVLTDIYELQQNASLARTNYERLNARVNDLRAQADLQIADSRVVAPATPPTAPSFPNPPLIFAIATLLALGVGSGLAFIVENFVGGFVSVDQLEAVSRREVAASIPLQKLGKRPDGSASTSAADAVIVAPLSQFSESLRRLRLHVEQGMHRSDNPRSTGKAKVVVVSSSVPVEGKSTVAIGLARTYSAAGKRVLILDADLRKPSLHLQIGVSASNGLFDYLVSDGSAEFPASILTQDPLSEASVIVGARHSDVPTEQLLTNATFVRLIDAAKTVFDIIIVDTPPVGVVVDGIYVMQIADAVVFVTRWGSTSQRDVLRSLDSIERAKDPNVPLVLAMTQQPSPSKGYQDRYYSYYQKD